MLGFGQGALLDCVTVLSQLKGRRRWLWTDVFIGPVLAVITFFGALLICDGQLHPVILFGVLAGMGVEHASIGFLLRWLISRLARILRRIGRAICRVLRMCKQFCCEILLCVYHKALFVDKKAKK